MTSWVFSPRYHLQLNRCTRLNAFYKNIRLISSKQNQKECDEALEPAKINTENAPIWLNIRAGIFGPSDNRMPLPGDIGINTNELMSADLIDATGTVDICRKEIKVVEVKDKITISGEKSLVKNFLKKKITLRNYYELSKRILAAEFKYKAYVPENYEHAEFLDCKIFLCPELLRKDLSTLFPNRTGRDNLLVIVLCQRTENDMSTWSEAVEEEREKLMNYFIQGAKQICNDLKRSGSWADFIDPTSGRPFYGPYTPDTFFETDDRYRRFGFTIEDLGCCRIISHKQFGPKIFVGAIFTNSLFDSVGIYEAIAKFGQNS